MINKKGRPIVSCTKCHSALKKVATETLTTFIKYGDNWFLVRLKYETYVCTNCGDKTKWMVSEQKLKKVSLKEIQEAYG